MAVASNLRSTAGSKIRAVYDAVWPYKLAFLVRNNFRLVFMTCWHCSMKIKVTTVQWRWLCSTRVPWDYVLEMQLRNTVSCVLPVEPLRERKMDFAKGWEGLRWYRFWSGWWNTLGLTPNSETLSWCWLGFAMCAPFERSALFWHLWHLWHWVPTLTATQPTSQPPTLASPIQGDFLSKHTSAADCECELGVGWRGIWEIWRIALKPASFPESPPGSSFQAH